MKEIAGGRVLEDVIENVEPNVVWGDDNKTVYYIEKDPVTLLGRRVRRHLLGSTQTDPIVYEEPDESFGLAVERSKSERFVFIGSESTTSSEWRYAPADDLTTAFAVFAPRREDHEYQIDHLDDRFFVRSNWKAQNFCVAAVAVASRDDHGRPDRWQSIVPHDPLVLIQDFELFREFLAVSERSGGLSKIRFQRWGESAQHLAAEVEIATLAQRYEVSGGAIANVIRHAALAVLRDGRNQVGLAELRAGLAKELRKEGRTL